MRFIIDEGQDIERAAPDYIRGHARQFVMTCLKRDPSERPTCIALLEHAFLCADDELYEEDCDDPVLVPYEDMVLPASTPASPQQEGAYI
eukprot:gene43532-24192_t